jgi:hypothetical protein
MDWNYLCTSILHVLLGRLQWSNTFLFQNFIKQGFLPNKTYIPVSNHHREVDMSFFGDVALVDDEAKHVKTWSKMNLSRIFLLLH